jgi:TP901-1 family phage major tail protein
MAACNTVQKELGGKDLLLRTCKQLTVSTTNADENITSVGHGLVVGDIVKFRSVGANTVINADDFYFVVAAGTTFQVSATPGGAAITMDDTEAGLIVDAYVLVGGLRSKSLSMSSEAIDITNQESGEWKTMLDGSGVRAVALSASGVYTSEEHFRLVRTAFLNNALICFMLQDTKNDELIESCFKVSSLEISGDYDAEGEYSISADSSGPVTIFQAP